ncbi:MAG: hypothetical protein WBC22_20270, partial [Sedimentisphaerales bacterium]
MKPLRPSIKWALAAFGVLFVLFILKIALLLTAKPKITVDYVAEYNRTSRPQDYDPNEVAAPYYQKAFDAFVDMPGKVRRLYTNWPTDFNETDQNTLRHWVASNEQAFGHFRDACRKPYYWLEKKSRKDNSILDIKLTELHILRELTRALLWDAKIKAIQGQFQPAFENILTCYSAGRHKCRPNLLLTDQHNGLGIKKEAVDSALVILNNTKVEDKALEFFQNALESKLNADDYIPSIRAEKYLLYDAIQRIFIDNGKGTGRLAWGVGWYIEMLCGRWNNFRRRFHACFAGPTRNEIVGQIERVLTISDQVMAKTPWQIKNQAYDYFDEIEKINNSNWFFQILGVSPKSTFELYHKTRAQTEALITILAIMRFKIAKENFPETLDELISAGYLKAVPSDPYSSGPLVYKRTEDNFKLYSVGKDYSDDGGVIEIDNKARQGPGFGRTIIIPEVYSPDIVYWPYKDLMKLRHEF